MLVWHRLNSAGTAYETQGIVEDAYSVVWTERWQDYGEAQVDLPPTHDVRTGDLLTMPERDMVVEVTGRTETEKGVRLRCKDALSILDRRIVYPTVSNNGLISTFVTKLLTNGDIITAGGIPVADADPRTLLPVRVGLLAGITGSANIQRSYGQVGETLLEIARAYGFNPYCRLDGSGLLNVWTRANSQTRVWGIGRYLTGYTEDVDESGLRNVAYVGAQELSPGRRQVASTGDARSMDRREMFVDRRDLATQDMDRTSATTQWGEFTDYGTMSIHTVTRGDSAPYEVYDLEMSVSVYSSVPMTMRISSMASVDAMASQVQGIIAAADTSVRSKRYQGYWNDATSRWVVTIGSQTFAFTLSLLDYGDYAMNPQAATIVLAQVGRDELAQHQPETAFEATVEGLTPYVDYALGDAVAVFKADGSRKDMRVVEVVESWDSQGYKATPGLASL